MSDVLQSLHCSLKPLGGLKLPSSPSPLLLSSLTTLVFAVSRLPVNVHFLHKKQRIPLSALDVVLHSSVDQVSVDGLVAGPPPLLHGC